MQIALIDKKQMKLLSPVSKSELRTLLREQLIFAHMQYRIAVENHRNLKQMMKVKQTVTSSLSSSDVKLS